MSERVSRRDFLKLAGAGAGGLILWGLQRNQAPILDPVFKVELDGNPQISYKEACDLALRFDRAYDRLPKIPPDATHEGLLKYALEIIPQFEYEGIVSKAAFPEDVTFNYYPDGRRANHVLGQSNCSTLAVVNSRIANTLSSWYEDESLVLVVAHELAHVAQGRMVCATADRDFLENSAQVAAIEVASGLALSGNKEFFGGVVRELRSMTLNTAYALALKENRLEEFEQFRRMLSPGSFSEARFQRSRRQWQGKEEERQEMLERYSLTPILMIVDGIRRAKSVVNVAFPVTDVSGRTMATEKLISINDTAYLIENLEGLAREK